MKIFTSKNVILILIILILTVYIKYAHAQRIYANANSTNATGLLCLNCTVTNPGRAADGNLQTFSVLNVSVGLAAQTNEYLIFPGTRPAAGTPVTVKLGSGDKLLSLTALGGITLQAYNGTTPIGQPVAVSTLLSVLSNNNQAEVTFTPQQAYDRVRVSLNGGLAGVLSSIYLYEAFYNGPAAALCNNAIDELHGISPGLLNLGVDVGGVANPQLAIDGNINTASTINAGISAVGAYAQQTIIYESPSVIGDSVRLTLSVPQALISAGVLSNITVSSFNGNTSNNDLQVVSSPLLTLRLLDLTNNRQRFTVTFVPTKVFDRVQLTLGGLANVLSTLNLYEAERLIPAPVIKINNVAGNNAQICAGGTATFTATAVPNTVFHWYTAATGGTAVFTGAAFTTPALTTTTSYYVAAMRNGCTDESERTRVTATVNAIPAAPVVTSNNVAVCNGNTATFNAQSVAGVTVNWYTAATGGTLLATGNAFTTTPLTQNQSYYAEAVSAGSCTSPARTKVTATVTAPPAAPALSAPNTTICDGSVAVLAIVNPQTGVSYNWYSTSTGGTALFTGPTFTTPVLHSNTTYYVDATNAGGCISTQRTQALVTVVAVPANPVLVANNTSIAAGQSTSIAVTNAQTGINYSWYTSATAGTPVFTGTTFQTPALYASTTYYVNGINSTGCTSAARTAITINVSINNNAPCSFANQQTPSVNGICIGCAISNPALATDADTTTASTISTLAGLVGGYAQQQLVFQQAGFKGDTIKLVLQNPGGLLSAAVLGQIQVIVSNGATQVSSYLLNNALIKLSLLTGPSHRYAVYIPAASSYDRVTVRLNSGAVSALTSLNIYYALQQFPKPVLNPLNPEVCKGSPAVLNITSPANGTLTWYATPTGGTSVHTGASFTTPALTANTTYYVEYSRGSCPAAVRYPVQVVVDDIPVAPTVTAQNVTITSGQTATLNATAANNATVQWFTAATGGAPIYTGSPFITPVLTANTTYYAGTATGSCTSATRTPVQVTVQPVVIPTVAVTPPTVTLNPGQTTAFTATSTTPGVVFNWFTTPTGGTSIYTGAAYTTPAEFSNITYYAEASVPVTGAKSATRASGSVIINQSAFSPVACDAAIDQTNATSGLLCVGCSINNAGGSVDNDRNTFSQLSVPVGLVNSYAQQTLRFANTGLAGDSVIVELGIPGTLASAGVLSQISISTLNGATANNDAFSVNGSLINITVLNGASRFRIAFKAQHNFDRVQVRLGAALAGVFNTLNIYDAMQEVPSPVISTAAITVCQGSQATFTATAPSDVTVKWYAAKTGGPALFTGNVFTTPALTASTTYYAEAARTTDGCTQAVRTPATVTVDPVPGAPVVANNSVTVCSGQPATFNVQAVSGVTYNWFTAATGGTSVHAGATFTTAPLTATTLYYVEASNGGQCSSSTRTPVTANVTETPVNAVVTPAAAQTCSGNSAVLTASSTQAGVTFNWYTSATGGTPVFTGAQFNTPALTANTSYYVETASGTCVSATRTRADVTVNPLPAAPVIAATPSNKQISAGQTAQLTATSATVNVTFNWYTSATGGSPVATGASFTTPALTNTTTYYVEAVSGTTGCTSSQRTPVTITVNPVFSTSCDFASTQTTDINNGLVCLLCSVTGNNNSVDTDTTNFSQLNLPLGVAGYVGQKLIFGDTGAAGDTVTVKIGIPISLATAGALNQLQIASYNGAIYNNDRISLSSSLLKIQILQGGQAAVVKFVPKAAFNAVELRIVSAVSLFSSLNIYYASKQVPVPQLNVKTVNVCAGGNATFTVTNPHADVTYKWYTTATGTSSVHSGTAFTTAALNATTTYYVESSRTSNGCANPNRVAATVNVTPLPVNPVLAQNTVQVCSGDQVTLTVTNANGATVNWYDAQTGGTLLFTGPGFTVSPIATVSYYAEITNGNCASSSRTQATVTVNPRPAAPGVQSANVQVCTGSPATLQVLNPANGVTYDWFTAATGGTAIFSGSTFNTPLITQNTVYYVQATSTATGCSNNGSRTQVNISVTNQASAPVLSAANTQICSGGSVTLSVENPVNGLQYIWYTQAAGGTPVFTGTTFTISDLTADVSYYVEAATSNGCASTTRTKTDITVQPVPTAPQVQADAGGLSVCSGSVASLSIVNPQANVVYRWYDAATGGTLLYTGSQFNTPALTVNTTYYVEASQAGNCNPSARTQVTITINALPAAPVLANANVSVCSGSPATLTISTPQTGVTYQWFDSPGLNNKLFEGTTYVTAPVTVNTTYYISAVNATGCQSANLTVAQVTIQAPPSAPVVGNGNTVQTCSGTAATLTISNPQNGFTYNWYTAAAGGVPLYTGTSFTTPALTANITYYADAVNSTGCTSSVRTTVTINVNPLPVAPVVTAQGGSNNTSVCPDNTITLTATSATANVSFNWYTQAIGGTPVFTGANYTTPPVKAATIYYVEAVSNTGTCGSATRTAVQVTLNNSTTPQPQVDAADLSICQNTAATLHISNPDALTTYNWFTAANGGSAVYTGTAFTTPVLSANTSYYVEAKSQQSCNPSARLAVNVVIVPQPVTPTLTAATVSVCKGSTATLAVQSPQNGIIYHWYASATRSNLLFTGPSYTTAAINSNTTFYVDANNGACSSSSIASVLVNVTDQPAAPILVNASQSVCKGSQAIFIVSSPQTGFIYNWYTSANGGTPVYTGVNFTTPALSANTAFYAEAVNATGCQSTSRTSATATVLSAPPAPQITSAGASICPGSTANLTATTDAGSTIKWYAAAAGGAALASGNSFTTPALTATTTYYAEASNSGGCTSASRTAVTVKVLQQLDAPVVTVSAATPASITFSWAAISGATGYEYSLNNGTSFSDPSDNLSYTVDNLQPSQSISIIVKAAGSLDCQLSASSAAVTGTTTNPLGDQIFIPNAFSPNGDGKNDVFYVYGTVIKNVSISIYDQWGGLIFNSNRMSAGWDGTFKGKAQPVGVYVYYVEATLNDGQTIKRKGTINLLR